MSKISAYIQSVQQHFKETSEKTQTVAEFAEELRKPVNILLEQLQSAGLSKSKNDIMLESDKQTLLEYLQKSHSSEKFERKKITLTRGPSEAVKMWRAVAENKNGSAWEVLENFSLKIIYGQPIDPDLQRLVNLIIAKSFLEGALPNMRRGRPKSDDVEEMSMEVAQMYWDLRDGGKSYADAVEIIANQIYKDERHIMRMVEANTSNVGHTLEDRERKRQWRSLMREMRRDANSHPSIYEKFINPDLPPELTNIEFDTSDYIDHLDELINSELNTKEN
ncbi:translation initiation factor IF-2 N-terminal domain-containing protein [Limnohabitans radicicola]|uniref:Translation initiation factor IF-2 N-terminal domain-containing protein n=1 Tax=Limnohabitans radicicola TaxID=2771427 RepID=A0A927IMN2_9BURK|nr:translation initiation factor IF-2 N-terminal domain-containing protein [Limnohabitans radicicola]MBD8051350.1 hypothetical protein [Limnohabitans radicicola]